MSVGDQNLPDFERIAAEEDPTDNEPSPAFEAAKASSMEVARLLWSYRQQLRAVGFEAAEAQELVVNYQCVLLGGRGEDDD